MDHFPVGKIAELVESDSTNIEQTLNSWLESRNERNLPPTPDIKLLSSLSGLSTTSVSNFLRNKQGSISKKNASKLATLVELVGYIPNRAAQNLRNQNNNTVAIALPLTSVSPSFYIEILSGIKDEIAILDYNYLIYDITTDKEREQFFNTMPFLDMADGIITVALDIKDNHLSILQKHLVPVVTIHNRLSNPPVVTNVVTPGEQAFVDLINFHLINYHGYQRLALVRLSNELKLGTQARTDWNRSPRLEAYREALRLNNIPLNEDFVFEVEEHSFEAGIKAFDQIYEVNENLPETERIQAVVCTSDTLAVALFMTCNQRGYELPITGFDNLPLSDLVGITTVDQHPKQLGKLAFRQLYNAMMYKRREGDLSSITDESIEMQVVIRQSCGCDSAV